MPPTDIPTLRKLMEQASQTPWMNNQYHKCGHTHTKYEDLHPVFYYAEKDPKMEADAEYIVAAVNALPALLAELEALRAEVARLRVFDPPHQLPLIPQETITYVGGRVPPLIGDAARRDKP